MYMAHLRTIVQEIFASGDYLTTANTIRTTIDASVQADPYKFYTYTQYQNSLTTSVTGSGPGGGSSIPGIQQLMDTRVTYFNTNSNYTLVAPTITSFTPSSTSPYYGQNITMTVTTSNETSVYFGYRFNVQDKFTRLAMYDDGAHNDGAAGDHVYGVSVALNCSQMQYYFYAENANAGLFSPQRAEHEFHTLSVILPWPTQGQVVINEIMADNGTTALDNYNENDDWIELYNTTSSAKDLSGMYLSDDPLLLNEWQFPSGSFIAPNSYLIVWVDKDADQSGLHANFKLSSAGESVIFGNGTTVFDQVDFTAQTMDVSFARCPDAGVFDFTAPTFGVTNNCFAGIADESALDVRIYPVPTSDKLTIVSGVNYQFCIVDLLGRSIASGELSIGDTVLDLSSSTSGVYEVIFTDAKGNRWSRPIIKN